jgi:GT2 family glycosyltransferase
VVNENGLCEHLYKNLPSNLAAANRPRYFRTLTGACLLIDRDLFFRLGGFDLAYVKMGGCEDTDLCFKVIEQGKSPAYCPTSVVYHHEGVTRGVRDEHHPEDLNNRRILAERWSHYLRPDMSDYLLLAEIEDEEGERWKRLEEIPAS